MVFHVFQPFVNEQNISIFRTVEITLLLLPWISYAVAVIKFGVKGLVVFGVIFLASYVLFNFFLN
jgi:hypothetical protein